MSKLTTGSFSIEDLESVQITINNIVGAATEVAKGAAKGAAKEKEEHVGPMGPTPPYNRYLKGLEFYTVRPL